MLRLVFLPLTISSSHYFFLFLKSRRKRERERNWIFFHLPTLAKSWIASEEILFSSLKYLLPRKESKRRVSWFFFFLFSLSLSLFEGEREWVSDKVPLSIIPSPHVVVIDHISLHFILGEQRKKNKKVRREGEWEEREREKRETLQEKVSGSSIILLIQFLTSFLAKKFLWNGNERDRSESGSRSQTIERITMTVTPLFVHLERMRNQEGINRSYLRYAARYQKFSFDLLFLFLFPYFSPSSSVQKSLYPKD